MAVTFVSGDEMIDRIAAHARMNATAASTDRALILSYLIEAAQVIAMEAELVHTPLPTTFSLNTFTDSAVTATNASASVTNVSAEIVDLIATYGSLAVTIDGVEYTGVSATGTTLTISPVFADTTNTRTLVVTLPSRSDYDVLAPPFSTQGFLSIDSIRLTDSANTNLPLSQVTMSEMDELRMGTQANTTPFVYAFDFPRLVLHPVPLTGSTLEVSGTTGPPTIADTAATYDFIPAAFVWGTLVPYALSMAYEYKDQPGKASAAMTRFLSDKVSGLPALKRYVARSGGRQRPSGEYRGSLRTHPSQDFGVF